MSSLMVVSILGRLTLMTTSLMKKDFQNQETQRMFLSALNIYNPVASPLSLTNYILKVTDFYDCFAYDTVEVDVFANAVANAGNDIDTCANVPVLLQASGGVSYLWYDSLYLNHNNTANPLSFPEDDQSFIVQVTDSNGCIDTDTVQIFIFLAKTFEVKNIKNKLT